MDSAALLQLGFALIFLGFMLVFIAFVLLMLSRGSEGETRGAAVFFIGPIPIAVGTDKNSLLIAVLLALAMILLLYLFVTHGW